MQYIKYCMIIGDLTLIINYIEYIILFITFIYIILSSSFL